MKRIANAIIATFLAIVLSGCTGKYPESEKYSGYLQDYSRIQPETSVSGTPVLRWISPDFKTDNYDSVYILPVTYWPDIPVSDQLQKEKLQSILDYTNQRLRKTLAATVPVVDKPGPRTLTLRSAITAVDVQKQGLNVWEVMPVSALIVGTQYLTGYRTLDVTFYFEVEVSDSLTHKPLISAIRRSQSATLSNSYKQLTIDESKESIDELVRDFALYSKNS